MSKPNSFCCGVVEGFYGRPWTTEQRKNLFALQQHLKLNMYMYAPKDDCKHRIYWREMYSVEEAEHLTSLIQSAKENNVQFVYALSPGLDITFSSTKEITALKRKLEQVKQFGCEAFSLLFDDIDTDMCAADKEVFQTFAHAQVSVANEVFQHLGQPKFLFCPTEYCATRAEPSVRKSDYLKTLGSKLLPDIQIMWTGPKVVPKVILVESIVELTSVIKRKPVIWDNIHANDYDQKRVFLGPYKGRSSDLHSHISGILTNPNCEYEANYIALHTLATWLHCSVRDDMVNDNKEEPNGGPSSNPTISAEIKLETEGDNEPALSQGHYPNHGSYDPELALRAAVNGWMEVIQTPRNTNDKRALLQPLLPLAPAAPPIPSINTCMSVTTPTATTNQEIPSASATLCTTDWQLSDELMNNKKAFDKLASLSVVAGNFKPIANPVNALVAGAFPLASEPLEPMDCNGDSAGKEVGLRPLLETAPPTAAAVAAAVSVPTKMSSNISTITTTDCKVSEVAMQVDDDKSTEPVRSTSPGSPCDGPHAGKDAVSAMTDTDAEMQSEGADVDSQPDDDDARPDSGRSDEEETMVKRCKKSLELEKLTAEDVLLLADLFYLPYEHGRKAVEMLEEIHWLKINAHHVTDAKTTKKPSDMALQWADRALHFTDFSRQVHRMMMRLLNVPNRSLLYDFYPYVWDMEGVISMLASFIKWLGTSRSQKETFMSGDLEPWVFRGGLTAEFQRMLPLNGAADLFTKKPFHVSNKVYTIRPYLPNDEDAVYRVCLLTSADGEDGTSLYPDQPHLIADRLAGPFITLSREYCFVLCDGDNIVGYSLAALNAKKFHQQVQVAWIEEMQKKYPKPTVTTKKPTQVEKTILSFHDDHVPLVETLLSRFPSHLRMNVLPCVEDTGVVKNILACVLSALKTSGSHGTYVEVCSDHKSQIDFYAKLGFVEIPDVDDMDGITIMGRAI